MNTTIVQDYDLACEEPMVIQINIRTSMTTITSNITAMIGCGASTQFIDSKLVRKRGLALKEKPYPECLIVVDGRETKVPLTHTCTLKLLIYQHPETIVLQVMKLAGRKIILGNSWL